MENNTAPHVNKVPFGCSLTPVTEEQWQKAKKEHCNESTNDYIDRYSPEFISKYRDIDDENPDCDDCIFNDGSRRCELLSKEYMKMLNNDERKELDEIER